MKSDINEKNSGKMNSGTIKTDFLIIGAGIVGLAVAKVLRDFYQDKEICIIEKENYLGAHGSGRNSGVLHAGFYYTPDSLKAKLTKQGNQELKEFCERKGLKLNRCGKVVVAKNEDELKILFELKKKRRFKRCATFSNNRKGAQRFRT
jgi:L-2-hydroxyglutarate oxidase LhgO